MYEYLFSKYNKMQQSHQLFVLTTLKVNCACNPFAILLLRELRLKIFLTLLKVYTDAYAYVRILLLNFIFIVSKICVYYAAEAKWSS